MSSLAAYLRNNNFDIDLCLIERESNGLHNFETILSSEKKFVIIAKPNFKDYPLMFPILEKLKMLGIADKVFFCGPFVSINSDSMLEEIHWLDGIILGQPEQTSLELLKNLEKKCEWWNTPGGIWRSPKNKIIPVQKSHDIKLNDLPFPSRDIEQRERGNYVNIESSRGCVYDCSFCHVRQYWKSSGNPTSFDFRNPKLVVDEMESINYNLGKTLFIFNDTIFWRNEVDNARLIEFANEIIKRKLNIRLYVYLRCKPFINPDVLNLLADAGLVRVFLGLENASHSSQSIFNKIIEIEQFNKIKSNLDKLNINTHIGYVVFEPYSSLKDIEMNIKLLYGIEKLFRLGVILEPIRVIRGSGLYKKLVKDKLIKDNLNYDQITYGYKFIDKKTERLLSGIQSMFTKTIGNISFNYEYYVTTVGLIKTLLKRELPKKYDSLQKDFADFEKLKKKSMDILYKYFIDSIYKIDQGGKSSDIADLKQNEMFIKSFTNIYYKIGIKHAQIIADVKSLGGEKIINEIYNGIDRII